MQAGSNIEGEIVTEHNPDREYCTVLTTVLAVKLQPITVYVNYGILPWQHNYL